MFSPNVKAGFTTTAIDALDIEKDLGKLIKELDLDLDFSYLDQIHTDKINLIEKGGIYQGDGLFTDRKNL